MFFFLSCLYCHFSSLYSVLFIAQFCPTFLTAIKECGDKSTWCGHDGWYCMWIWEYNGSVVFPCIDNSMHCSSRLLTYSHPKAWLRAAVLTISDTDWVAVKSKLFLALCRLFQVKWELQMVRFSSSSSRLLLGQLINYWLWLQKNGRETAESLATAICVSYFFPATMTRTAVPSTTRPLQ